MVVSESTIGGPQECYNRVYHEIMMIHDDRLKSLRMPLDEAMHEGKRTVELVRQYDTFLRQSIISPHLLDTIELRSNAFDWSVANYETAGSEHEMVKRAWQQLKKEGYSLRMSIRKQFMYLLRDQVSTFETLKNFGTKKDDLQMISDLLSLYKIGISNKEKLATTPSIESQLESLRTLHAELSDISSQLDLLPKHFNESFMLCKRAWTYLYEALCEIHKAGQFIFRDTPETKKLFYISYFQKTGQKAYKNRKTPGVSTRSVEGNSQSHIGNTHD